jgi:hypothetical protein
MRTAFILTEEELSPAMKSLQEIVANISYYLLNERCQLIFHRGNKIPTWKSGVIFYDVTGISNYKYVNISWKTIEENILPKIINYAVGQINPNSQELLIASATFKTRLDKLRRSLKDHPNLYQNLALPLL